MSIRFVAIVFALLMALLVSPPLQATEAPAATPTIAFRDGMKRLDFLRGHWQVQPWQLVSKQSELVAGENYPLLFQSILADRYLRGTGRQDGTDFEVTLSFDEQRAHYRLSLLDSVSGVLDIYQGQFIESGALRLENDHGWRFEFSPRQGQGQGWLLHNYVSKNGGSTWTLVAKYVANPQ